ncbi:MAG: 1-acyl-sn-glycerol-3-phosphate acyltransferase, partial [Clostridia bacterium]|nr:1-acyl-sn-glycerol-3-phosphate acyltransferase [Clostridia bacterium]
MKIKQIKSSWKSLSDLPKLRHVKPLRPLFVLRLLIRILSIPDLFATRFSYTDSCGDRKEEGPYLILMNHSGFIDLKVASKILFPLKYHIVATTDAFVGKSLLMRFIGCIPTQKFVTDASLVLTLMRLVKKKKTSVLMYPEAGYSFDGRATLLPEYLGNFVKRLGAPVLFIRSDEGVFLRDPLYNGLRLRKVKAKADLSVLLTRGEIASFSAAEIQSVLEKAFDFDHFAAQREKKISVKEPFRATGLERLLYRCPHCEKEGVMRGEGILLTCTHCGAAYTMDEYGQLENTEGKAVFSHIPDWYDWERECVKKEIEEGRYAVDIPVKVGIICDHRGMYMLGEGRLSHSKEGFTLISDDGTFTYHQEPSSSYTLNADFFFYDIGDMVSVGTKDRLFYCFPTEKI